MEFLFGVEQEEERAKLLRHLSHNSCECRFEFTYMEHGSVKINVMEAINEIISDDCYCTMLTGLNDEYFPGTIMLDKDFKHAILILHEEVSAIVVYKSIVAILSSLFLNDNYLLIRGYYMDDNTSFITGINDLPKETILLLNKDNIQLYKCRFISASINPLFCKGSCKQCNNITKVLSLFCSDFFLLDNYIVAQLKKDESDHEMMEILNYVNAQGVIIKANSYKQLEQLYQDNLKKC